MLTYYGRVSLFCFLSSCSLLLLLLLEFIPFKFSYDPLQHVPLFFSSYYLIWNGVLFCFLRGYSYQVGVRAAFLGMVFSGGIFVSALLPDSFRAFGWYMCFLSFFHFSEFFAIAVTDSESASVNSFMLNHSIQYNIAAISSWLEFFIELYFFPNMKLLRGISYFGIILCVGGEIFRKLAIFTAAKNFNHIVQSVKKEDHVLVTHGVYQLCRHPSYVGWFYWSIGTQLILINPICTIGYTLASWSFFHDRLISEEIALINFFGADYIDYQKKVGTGLPFISGFILDEE